MRETGLQRIERLRAKMHAEQEGERQRRAAGKPRMGRPRKRRYRAVVTATDLRQAIACRVLHDRYGRNWREIAQQTHIPEARVCQLLNLSLRPEVERVLESLRRIEKRFHLRKTVLTIATVKNPRTRSSKPFPQ